MRTLRVVGAVGFVVLLATAACSSKSDEDPTAEASSTTETTAEGRGATSETTGSNDEEQPRSEDEQSEGEALGTATARLPAAPSDDTLVPMRLDVTGLERLDGMVELRVTLANEGRRSTPAFEPYSSFDDPRLPAGQGVYSLSGASLVDAGGERAYLTIVDSEGTCLCTGRLADVAVAAGDSFEMYADFGGVPDDLDEIDVQVPGFPTVASVPIG